MFSTKNYVSLSEHLLAQILKMTKSSMGIFYLDHHKLYKIKTGVSFQHLLRHRNSASESVISTLKSVYLSVKTTLLSVKTTLRLSYPVLEMTV
jgi:hypothetical protein